MVDLPRPVHNMISSTDYNIFTLCFRVNLYDFADILISKGVINAINLDGGGSATFLVDGILTNHPSDTWYVSLL